MYHLLIPAAVAAGYAIVGLFILSYSAVQEWIKKKAVRNGYVDLIREKLEKGHYTVIAGAFSATGSAAARRTWTDVRIDNSMRSKFGAKDAIRIKT
jgi:hypothetical protein